MNAGIGPGKEGPDRSRKRSFARATLAPLVGPRSSSHEPRGFEYRGFYYQDSVSRRSFEVAGRLSDTKGCRPVTERSEEVRAVLAQIAADGAMGVPSMCVP